MSPKNNQKRSHRIPPPVQTLQPFTHHSAIPRSPFTNSRRGSSIEVVRPIRRRLQSESGTNLLTSASRCVWRVPANG
ncbi:hypothetical protein M758_7G091200 [Ceratodon purpureus]|nr:hypothetical protein M758_7G091200 [Ceratodon purpureus]